MYTFKIYYGTLDVFIILLIHNEFINIDCFGYYVLLKIIKLIYKL